MRKMTFLLLAACFVAIICPALVAQPKRTPEASRRRAKAEMRSTKASEEIKLVDIGGFKLRMKVAGQGTPSIVFDAGFSDRLESWDDIFADVARLTRVVAYDRAGLGKSDRGPEPRTFTEI